MLSFCTHPVQTISKKIYLLFKYVWKKVENSGEMRGKSENSITKKNVGTLKSRKHTCWWTICRVWVVNFTKFTSFITERWEVRCRTSNHWHGQVREPGVPESQTCLWDIDVSPKKCAFSKRTQHGHCMMKTDPGIIYLTISSIGLICPGAMNVYLILCNEKCW